ncbi:DUF3556 domain-containing protein, partial [Streptomyces brasiliscabiei]
GRGLFSLAYRTLPDIETRTIREAEFACNSLIGFNFGDGHLHDAGLIRAVQSRCRFEPGELVVFWVESQPIHRGTQSYQIIDAALGVIERDADDAAHRALPRAIRRRPVDLVVRLDLVDRRAERGERGAEPLVGRAHGELDHVARGERRAAAVPLPRVEEDAH